MKHLVFNLALFLIFLAHSRLHAQQTTALKLASVLQSNMVVQQAKPFKIWGTAPAGQTVAIQADWMKHPVKVVAGDDQKFLGLIPVPEATTEPFSKHHISVVSGSDTVTLSNLLIGDVWICSGQSNMQFGMRETIDSAVEISAANYPAIRLFSGGRNFSNVPLDSIKGTWQQCTPQTVRNFSAVAYHFGRTLHNKLHIPIGLIFTGIGASAAQAYVPQNVLAADTLLNRTYLQPYMSSPKSKEKIDGGFTFEKVTRPFLLYNGIIHPFVNLSIKGFTWYQGESNRMERDSYTKLTQAMIQSWRKAFAQGELPFYYVQVAPFWYEQPDSTLADYAFFREEQAKVASLNNTGMVITMDVGEARDLHPKNKKPIGVRLAKTALNRTYGLLEESYRGPEYDYVIFEKEKVFIHFQPGTVKGGLATNDGGAPKFFTIAGADKIFYPATAQIVGSQVIVRSQRVKKPAAVRYAFTNGSVTNLQNGEGLPAVPFRTDDWVETEKDKVLK